MHNNLLIALCAVAIGLSSVSVSSAANDSNNGNISKIASVSTTPQQQHHDKLEIARLKDGAILGAMVVALGTMDGLTFTYLDTFQDTMEKGLFMIATIASIAVFHGIPGPGGWQQACSVA